ncbi:Similar to CG6379: Cap-specific mRNA (nucleoside-2'-O-)-methyltransferase 1 (Drosophila melanogaster) [Cotesia congregata]|uniref:Cap-specific mRNA (nucleoside-2'-O-)-methyltransferase 1 n=1 Tax=Cotesia congregata TaxID=51543 RepID=A0A8J2HL34_COTCN|nr:Similar to CG6379: Cap-specific mRNA (nucleoside-2'-O-)-methyltransferase 1 (Drosophila melanogaster) [Cotesia congregata]
MSIAEVLTENNNLSLTNSIMESSRLSSDSDGSAPTYSTMMSSKRKLSESDDDLIYDEKRAKFDNDSDNESNRELSHQVTPAMEQTTSDIGRRLMQKMGYSEGRGLGKYEQGRVAPVEAFQQKGRRGLGHDNKKLIEATLKWDPSAEVVDVHENMLWLDNSKRPPTLDEMNSWIVLGRRPDTIDNETLFCDPHIVQQVVNSKTIFDTLDKNEMHRARSRSNPFETIRGAFFLNRAAVKMANIDKACDFIFTQPQFFESNETLYFADVCAGPGGFSEYVLWRTKWGAKGFGFTLRDSNDFKLEDFYAASPETFHPVYGPKDDGNVYDPDNQQAFQRIIMQSTKNKGVHFMMSDGGFSVDGQENIQEILSKQLYLCQCLVALKIVREGGHFVTKVFDLFTPFSAGLIYIMHRCFRRVCIFKPNTSRPANSERYLICEDKLPGTEDVIQYFDEVNKLLLKDDPNKDVIELVPLDILQGDENFFMYLKESNESLGSKQVVGLLKIAAYCEDPTLNEKRQSQMRKECLQYWNLPDQSRTRPRDEKPDDRLQAIIGSALQTLYTHKPTILTNDNLSSTLLTRPCNWVCLPCETKNFSDPEKSPTFYYSAGRTKVYRYMRKAWIRVENIELPTDTFIYAEMVTEMRGESRTLRRSPALHIIDAWLLGNKDVSRMYLLDRYAMIEQFCELLWSPENKKAMRVRPKPLYSLDDDLSAVMNLKTRLLKNKSPVEALHPCEPFYAIDNENEREQFYIIPSSMIFLNSIKPPWAKYLSRSTAHHYFFNSQTGKQYYNDRRPDEVALDFVNTVCSRIIWSWQDPNTPTLSDLNAEIKSICPGNLPNKSSK